jgi:hypothetical protein
LGISRKTGKLAQRLFRQRSEDQILTTNSGELPDVGGDGRPLLIEMGGKVV